MDSASGRYRGTKLASCAASMCRPVPEYTLARTLWKCLLEQLWIVIAWRTGTVERVRYPRISWNNNRRAPRECWPKRPWSECTPWLERPMSGGSNCRLSLPHICSSAWHCCILIVAISGQCSGMALKSELPTYASAHWKRDGDGAW